MDLVSLLLVVDDQKLVRLSFFPNLANIIAISTLFEVAFNYLIMVNLFEKFVPNSTKSEGLFSIPFQVKKMNIFQHLECP